MRRIVIEVPEATARDLTAPPRGSDPADPTEARRRDARDEVEQLVRDALARPVEPARVATATFSFPAPAGYELELAGHVGHNIVVCSEGGVVTGMRCEDCDAALGVEDA